MAVGWAVVRSLAGFPGAGPTGADYLGGSCLLLATGFVIWEFRYVDSVRSKYADTVPGIYPPESTDSVRRRKEGGLGGVEILWISASRRRGRLWCIAVPMVRQLD